VVKTLNSGSLGNGATSFTWDGTQDNGSPAPAGKYTVAVIATDANGASVAADTQIISKVEAIRMTATGVKLVAGGVQISMTDIQEIRL